MAVIDFKTRRALEARYDGPLPLRPAVNRGPIDGAQIVSNLQRRYSEEVRRIGRELVFETRMLRATGSVVHLNRWRQLREQLRLPLNMWKMYRDEGRKG